MNAAARKFAAVLLSTALAAGLWATPAAALAPQAAVQGASVLEMLEGVPLLGDVLRSLFGGEEEPAPAPTPAPTAEPTPAPTQEPTPRPQNQTGTPVWGGTWMRGSAAAGYLYPAGSADAETPAAACTLWSVLDAGEDVTIKTACREETNLGDLTADALSQAVAAHAVYRDSESLAALPLVAVVNGAALTGNLAPGASLAETGEALAGEEPAALVLVTPQKLLYTLNAALLGIRPDSDTYGSFLQVSGMRFTYEVTNGDAHVKELWLAEPGKSEPAPLDLTNDADQIALALPQSLLETYGLTKENDYLNAFEGAEPPTLGGALAALAQNCDADTLAALLARQGSAGRILPASVGSYTAQLAVGAEAAGKAVRCTVDGAELYGMADETGLLALQNLAPGSHTVQFPGSDAAYYVSSITYIGVESGTPVTVSELPAELLSDAIPEEAAAQQAAAEQAAAEQAAQSAAQQPETPAPEPAAPPEPTAVPAINDPSAGLVLGVTPAPTLEPTASPLPTPSPTPDPAAEQRKEELRQAAVNLPLLIGVGVLAACVLLAIILLVQRRRAEKRRRRRNRSRRI